MVQQTLTDRAIEIARKRGVARTRDFMDAGIPRVYLQRLQKQGRLNRIGHGLYQVEGAVLSGQHSLAEAARTVPHGVVCLLSALQFHGLTHDSQHRHARTQLRRMDAAACGAGGAASAASAGAPATR